MNSRTAKLINKVAGTYFTGDQRRQWAKNTKRHWNSLPRPQRGMRRLELQINLMMN